MDAGIKKNIYAFHRGFPGDAPLSGIVIDDFIVVAEPTAVCRGLVLLSLLPSLDPP